MYSLMCARNNEALPKWGTIYERIGKDGPQSRICTILHQMVLDQTFNALSAIWMVRLLQFNVGAKEQEY